MATRTTNITIRTTPEEKKEIYKAAAVAGVTVTQLLLGILAGDNLGRAIKEFRK